MIQPALDALLMTTVGRTPLPAPPLSTALCAAVPLPAIAANADPEHRSAIRVVAKPLPENDFPVNRHPLLQAAFDNGCDSCHGNTNSEVAFFWHQGCLQRTPLRKQRGSFPSAFSRKQLTTSDLPHDERPMIAPAARMISSFSIPATVQKTTFSDER
jgi:hypothetical protein